jgi:hypothetical protein
MGESSGFTGNTNKSRFFDPIVFQYKVLRFPAFVIDQGRRAGFRARVRRDVYRRKAHILRGCFGSEIRALPQLQSPSTPLTVAATPRLTSG